MQGEMAPPRSVVVPQVMIRVAGVSAQRQVDAAGGREGVVHEVPQVEVANRVAHQEQP